VVERQSDLRVGNLVMDVDGSSLTTGASIFPNRERQSANIPKPEDIEREGKDEDEDLERVVDVGTKKEKEVIAAMNEPRDEEHRGDHCSVSEGQR
jgi:hypothetical protein